MLEDHFKKMYDQTGQELAIAAGTFALFRYLLEQHGQGNRSADEVVADFRHHLDKHDEKVADLARERRNAQDDAEVLARRAVSTRPCGVCPGLIFWNADEPTGQGRGWRHVDQVAAIEFNAEQGRTHRATPLPATLDLGQHSFVWDPDVGWCKATLPNGRQCFASYGDPIHPKPTEAAR